MCKQLTAWWAAGGWRSNAAGARSRAGASFLKTGELSPGSCRQTVGLVGRGQRSSLQELEHRRATLLALVLGERGKLSDRGGKTKASESTASLVGPAAVGRESNLSRGVGGAQPPHKHAAASGRASQTWPSLEFSKKNRYIKCYIKTHQFFVLKTDLDFLILCSSQGKCLWAKCDLQLARGRALPQAAGGEGGQGRAWKGKNEIISVFCVCWWWRCLFSWLWWFHHLYIHQNLLDIWNIYLKYRLYCMSTVPW